MGWLQVGGFLGGPMQILTKNGGPSPNGVAAIPKTKKSRLTWATLYVFWSSELKNNFDLQIGQQSTYNLVQTISGDQPKLLCRNDFIQV